MGSLNPPPIPGEERRVGYPEAHGGTARAKPPAPRLGQGSVFASRAPVRHRSVRPTSPLQAGTPDTSGPSALGAGRSGVRDTDGGGRRGAEASGRRCSAQTKEGRRDATPPAAREPRPPRPTAVARRPRPTRGPGNERTGWKRERPEAPETAKGETAPAVASITLGARQQRTPPARRGGGGPEAPGLEPHRTGRRRASESPPPRSGRAPKGQTLLPGKEKPLGVRRQRAA